MGLPPHPPEGYGPGSCAVPVLFNGSAFLRRPRCRNPFFRLQLARAFRHPPLPRHDFVRWRQRVHRRKSRQDERYRQYHPRPQVPVHGNLQRLRRRIPAGRRNVHRKRFLFRSGPAAFEHLYTLDMGFGYQFDLRRSLVEPVPQIRYRTQCAARTIRPLRSPRLLLRA